MYPQIYLGSTPNTSARRRALRALALELRARIHMARAADATTLLLHFRAGDGVAEAIDLLLLRPSAAIVGAVRSYGGPIETLPGGQWRRRDTGELLHEQRDRTPIQHVRLQRDAVRARLAVAAPELLNEAEDARSFDRLIGALILAPATHPDSRVSLEIGDHRQQLKVLGLDELPALASMVRLGVQLPDSAVRAIASEIFAARLWHDGARFLFDLAEPRFQMRVLGDDTRSEKLLTLIEGENVLGRRRSAQQYEHRLSLSGDELISGDHALIVCGDDDWVTLRDTSKNGTWITPPGGTEERVRGERTIFPGTLLRMGMTRARLE
ncbi:MAG TPA: FHA domain-containing protein, partial [Roseiflexaceae bacterium]|nr:FHA domain-containing protein [Roseiflexaceae bacterium]